MSGARLYCNALAVFTNKLNKHSLRRMKMKSLVLFLTLGLSLAATASSWKEYKDDSLELLNLVYATCPAELKQAMEGANLIVSAERVGGQMPVFENGKTSIIIRDTLTITTASRYIGYSFDVAKLTVTRDLIPDVVFVPSKPSSFKVTCKVELLKR